MSPVYTITTSPTSTSRTIVLFVTSFNVYPIVYWTIVQLIMLIVSGILLFGLILQQQQLIHTMGIILTSRFLPQSINPMPTHHVQYSESIDTNHTFNILGDTNNNIIKLSQLNIFSDTLALNEIFTIVYQLLILVQIKTNYIRAYSFTTQHAVLLTTTAMVNHIQFKIIDTIAPNSHQQLHTQLTSQILVDIATVMLY